MIFGGNECGSVNFYEAYKKVDTFKYTQWTPSVIKTFSIQDQIIVVFLQETHSILSTE